MTEPSMVSFQATSNLTPSVIVMPVSLPNILGPLLSGRRVLTYVLRAVLSLCAELPRLVKHVDDNFLRKVGCYLHPVERSRNQRLNVQHV